MKYPDSGGRIDFRLNALCVLLLIWVSQIVPAMAKAKEVKPPNIVFIMVDDMGYADLGCYGGKAIATPHLDRMAKEGMRFTQAYSGCVVCAPARSTLMTGFHMGHTSVRLNTGGVPLLDKDVTVAEVLKKAGYVTGGFGKWGLGDIGTSGAAEKQGFDEFYGYYHQIHAHEYYPKYLIDGGKKVMLPAKPNDRASYTHYLIVDRMKKFIRKHRDRPFFCYAPWTPPHGKYQIPTSDPAWKIYKDKKWPRNAKVAAAMDSMVDRHVGEVLALLQELKIDDRTIVFFCSDNGAAERFDGALNSSGFLRGRKRSVYEGGIRVPMIVRWPGAVKAGITSNLQWYFPDVLPTLAELGGARQHVPEGIDGLSIVPTLIGEKNAGQRQQVHEALYWEWHLYNWRKRELQQNGLMQGMRMGNWKLVRHRQNQPWELYDLSKDIAEKDNIADQHAAVVKKMLAWISANRKEPRPQAEPKHAKGRKFN